MPLNIVEINEKADIGFGLTYRVDRNLVTEACTRQIYSVSEDVAATEYPIDILTQDYYFPTSGVTMKISSDDNSDNQNLVVYYYSSPTDEEPLTQLVTLNGQTPVTLSSSVFRIDILVCNGASNNGNVYLYGTGATVTAGVPDSEIVCTLRPNIGFSQQSYFYVPKGWIAYLISAEIFNNTDTSIPRSIKLTAYRLLSYLAPSLRLKVQEIPLTNGDLHYSEDSAPSLSENSTYIVKAQRLEGTNAKITLTYRFVLFR